MVRLPKWVMVVLVLAFVLGVSTPAFAAEAKGKIKSIDVDKSMLVVTDKDGKDWTFEIDKTAKIKLADKEAKFGDLKSGVEATIVYEKKGDKLIVTEIRCEKPEK